jgi:hypothetical protein
MGGIHPLIGTAFDQAGIDEPLEDRLESDGGQVVFLESVTKAGEGGGVEEWITHLTVDREVPAGVITKHVDGLTIRHAFEVLEGPRFTPLCIAIIIFAAGKTNCRCTGNTPKRRRPPVQPPHKAAGARLRAAIFVPGFLYGYQPADPAGFYAGVDRQPLPEHGSGQRAA